MLQRTFKTAKELRISKAKYEALLKVYWLLVDEEIPERLFDMGSIGKPQLKEGHACGTAGCILGWCQAVDDVAFLRSPMGWGAPDYSGGLHWLFYSERACNFMENTTRAQAAQAIHNYLTTGASRWREVLKG